MLELLAAILLMIGSTFTLIAGIGVLRMEDVFIRMHAMTKAATFGLGCLFLAAAVAFADIHITLRSVAAIALLLSTTPVAAQLIGRAAARSGVPLSDRTVVNELEGRLESTDHREDI